MRWIKSIIILISILSSSVIFAEEKPHVVEKEKEGLAREEQQRLEKEREEQARNKKERQRIISMNNAKGVKYSRMLWRSAVVPGWGQYYANQKRGYVYAGLWASIGGTFLWSQLNYQSKNNEYMDATDDYNTKYDTFRSASKLRGYLSFAFIGIYLVSVADMALTGKSYFNSQKNSPPSAFQWKILFGADNLTHRQAIKDDKVEIRLSWRY